MELENALNHAIMSPRNEIMSQWPVVWCGWNLKNRLLCYLVCMLLSEESDKISSQDRQYSESDLMQFLFAKLQNSLRERLERMLFCVCEDIDISFYFRSDLVCCYLAVGLHV